MHRWSLVPANVVRGAVREHQLIFHILNVRTPWCVPHCLGKCDGYDILQHVVRISHECGLYLLAAVKFVYSFFPKEQYSREYTGVHKVLEQNPAAQRKLETLYRLCMKDLLSTERIYQLSLSLTSDPESLR